MKKFGVIATTCTNLAPSLRGLARQSRDWGSVQNKTVTLSVREGGKQVRQSAKRLRYKISGKVVDIWNWIRT